MKTVGEIGLKIAAATREYYRYTGVTAEMARQGLGSSRPELAWAKRVKQQEEEHQARDNAASPKTKINR